MNCPDCGSQMSPLFTGYFCPRDCDKKTTPCNDDDDDDVWWGIGIRLLKQKLNYVIACNDFDIARKITGKDYFVVKVLSHNDKEIFNNYQFSQHSLHAARLNSEANSSCKFSKLCDVTVDLKVSFPGLA